MVTPNQRLTGILLTVVFIMSIPFFAIQFTNEVNWSSSDFLIAGVLLLGTGLTCELVLRTVKKTRHRLILCGIVLLVLLLVWAELAVGVFGTRFAGS